MLCASNADACIQVTDRKRRSRLQVLASHVTTAALWAIRVPRSSLNLCLIRELPLKWEDQALLRHFTTLATCLQTWILIRCGRIRNVKGPNGSQSSTPMCDGSWTSNSFTLFSMRVLSAVYVSAAMEDTWPLAAIARRRSSRSRLATRLLNFRMIRLTRTATCTFEAYASVLTDCISQPVQKTSRLEWVS